MKKLINFLVLVLLVNFSVIAAGLEGNYYVLSSGEINNCKSIQFKGSEVQVVLENGEKIFVAREQIKAIKTNDKYYEKLPVYVNNKPTGREELMEFVATRGGLKLYKYRADITDEQIKGFNRWGNRMDYYIVFRGDQFWVEITDQNYQNLFSFFRV